MVQRFQTSFYHQAINGLQVDFFHECNVPMVRRGGSSAVLERSSSTCSASLHQWDQTIYNPVLSWVCLSHWRPRTRSSQQTALLSLLAPEPPEPELTASTGSSVEAVSNYLSCICDVSLISSYYPPLYHVSPSVLTCLRLWVLI